MKGTIYLLALLIFSSDLCSQQKTNQATTTPNSATILFDAFSKDTSLIKGWGFSTLIEFNGKRILFDAGSNADTFKENIARLGIDLKKLDFVVVSHTHYDHLNGIDYLLTINPGVKIYFPHESFWGAPSTFDARGRDTVVKDSLPASLRYFDGKRDVFQINQSGGRFLHANIEYVKESKELLPGIKLVATSAKYMGYFSKYPNSSNDDIKLNNLVELSLSLNTPKGEVLFTGCSHSGVENIIRETINITNNKIELVCGGFHLLPFDRNETLAICNMIQSDFKVAKVAPGHCTGHLAFKILSDLYKNDFIYSGLGEKITF
jgi:7,8-dihydropterin-6-yl-methyl-4-(beta-D-ribofuranosyl)aminobenzene 5'-phosphate synthase